MKKIFRPLRRLALPLGLTMGLAGAAHAQQNVGIGTVAPNAKAALEIAATDRGLLIPRMDSVQRTAISTPPAGLLVYQTNGRAGLWYYQSGAWQFLQPNLKNISAANGLTRTGNQVLLGGTLTQNTTLAQGGFNLGLTGGSVGIGTAAPAFRLHVVGGDTRIAATNAEQGLFGLDRIVGYNDLRFYTDDAGTTEQMHLSNTGKLGIGTGNPLGLLDLQGGADNTGANDPGGLALQYRTGGYRHFMRSRHSSTLTSGNALDFYLNNSSVAGTSTLAGTGNIAALTLENASGAPRVGVGTTAPAATLHVAGAGSTVRVESMAGSTDTRLVSADGLGNLTAGPLSLPLSTVGTAGQMVLTGSSAQGGNLRGVAVYNDIAYIASPNNGRIYLHSFANPAAPVYMSLFFAAGSGPLEVVIKGAYLYVTNTSNELRIFSLATPTSPTQVALVSTGAAPYGLAVEGTRAYVSCRDANLLQIFDVTTPSAPTLLGSVATGSQPYSVAVSGTTAFVTNYLSNTLQAFDVSNPAAPTSISTIGTGTRPYDVAVNGTRAYVTNYSSNTLQIFNVASPAAMAVLGSVSTGTAPWFVEVVGESAFVLNEDKTFLGFNCSTPTTPVAIGSLSLTSGTVPWGGIVARGGRLFVAASSSGSLGGLRIVDVQYSGLLGQASDGSLVTVTPASFDLTTASNGLTKTGSNFTLGGTLTGATTVATGANSLTVNGAGAVNVGTGTGATTIGNTTAATTLYGNGASVTGVGVGIRADGGLNLGQNTTGNNIAVGYQAGAANTTGASNFFQGYQAGAANTTGVWNHFDGYRAGAANTTGNYNTYIGYRAGESATTVSENFFVGHRAGQLATVGQNFAVGHTAGMSMTTGTLNSFGGYGSGSATTTGSNNTFYGLNSGSINTTGSNNWAFGSQAGPATNNLTNAGAIGYQAQVSQSNSIVLGGTGANAVSVGIGTTAPQARLHVVGGARLDGTNTLELGGGVTKEVNAGKIGYQTFTADALDIVGAGTTAGNRKVKIWAEGGTTINTLAGTGIRMVTANAAGDLGTAAVPAGESTTASNGLTLTGTNVALGGTLSSATTVAQGGNNLAFTGGNVGVGAATPTARLQVQGDLLVQSVAGTPGQIAQTVAAGSSGTVNGTLYEMGQTFTLPVAARLTSYSFMVTAGPTTTQTLRVYNGVGGTPVYTQTVTLSPGLNTYTLTTPPTLPAGLNMVTVSIPGSVGYFVATNGTNPYAGGGAYYDFSAFTGTDLYFVVDYVSTALTTSTALYTSATSPNVGIGTTSPAANLHVAGSGSTIRFDPLAGSGSRVVTVDAAGNLSAGATPAGQGDNLGNHTATQNINLASNKLVGFGGSVGLSIGSGGILNPENGLSLSDKDIYLRGTNTGDTNHGLGFYGTGKLWNTVNVDGPTLYGYSGGALGTNQTGTQVTALRWTSAGNVGVGGNHAPQVAMDVDGGLVVRDNSSTTLTADNQSVTVGDRSYLRLGSNNTTSGNRTITLTSGVQTGQMLIITNASSASFGVANGAFELADSGNVNSGGTRSFGPGDAITLIWDGAQWIELSFTNN